MTEFLCLEGEAVVIGDRVTVTVLEIDGEDVLLQIESGDEPAIAPGESELEVPLATC